MKLSPLQLHGLIEKGAKHSQTAPAHQRVHLSRFDAIISPYELHHDTAKVPPDDLTNAALKHHRILLAYCAHHALLPMRFGAVFSDEKALCDAMSEQEAQYADALALLFDHREYSIELLVKTTTSDAPAQVSATGGRNFLLNRKHIRDRQRNLAQDRQRFARDLLAQAEVLTLTPPQSNAAKPDQPLDLSILLPTDKRDQLQTWAAKRATDADALGLSLRIRGPWPAYHYQCAAPVSEVTCDGA